MMVRSQKGFSLIEVMVAVLIMAVGVLGMAGLQVISLQQNRSSLLRAEALQIGNDLLDRMRANPEGDYAGVDFDDAPSALQSCVNNACSVDEMAEFDIAQWKCSINSADADGDTYAICATFGIPGSLPVGAGAISLVGDVHQVSVRWTDGPQGQVQTVTLQTRTRPN